MKVGKLVSLDPKVFGMILSYFFYEYGIKLTDIGMILKIKKQHNNLVLKVFMNGRVVDFYENEIMVI